MNDSRGLKMGVGALLAGVMVLGLMGCEEKKEPVLRIETPRTKVEVNKSPEGGSVEIRTERPVESTPDP